MACLWPASYGVNAGFRVFAASLLWGFGRVAEITIGRWAKVRLGSRERGPVFVASLLWGFGRVAEITIGRWAKVIIYGGYVGGYPRGAYCRNGIKPHKRQDKTGLVWGLRGRK